MSRTCHRTRWSGGRRRPWAAEPTPRRTVILTAVNVRDPSGASTSPYHFDELGSVQFARVCAEILSLLCGVPPERWTHPLGRLPSATLFDDLADPSGRVLPGPVLAVSAWATADHPALAALRNNVLRSETLDGQIPRSLLVLTNRSEIVRASPGTPPGKPPVVASLGPEDLGRLIDHHAELRFRMPSLLGVRDLDGIVPGEALARSTGDIAAAHSLARVFMPTRAYTATLDVLRQRHFAVLTGPPEMGKTAIARTLALAALTTGMEVHECVRPDELWSAFDRHRPQVFIADDRVPTRCRREVGLGARPCPSRHGRPPLAHLDLPTRAASGRACPYPP